MGRGVRRGAGGPGGAGGGGLRVQGGVERWRGGKQRSARQTPQVDTSGWTAGGRAHAPPPAPAEAALAVRRWCCRLASAAAAATEEDPVRT